MLVFKNCLLDGGINLTQLTVCPAVPRGPEVTAAGSPETDSGGRSCSFILTEGKCQYGDKLSLVYPRVRVIWKRFKFLFLCLLLQLGYHFCGYISPFMKTDFKQIFPIVRSTHPFRKVVFPEWSRAGGLCLLFLSSALRAVGTFSSLWLTEVICLLGMNSERETWGPSEAQGPPE